MAPRMFALYFVVRRYCSLLLLLCGRKAEFRVGVAGFLYGDKQATGLPSFVLMVPRRNDAEFLKCCLPYSIEVWA